MLNAYEEDGHRPACSTAWTCVAVVSLPPAQYHQINALDVIHYLVFVVLVGVWAYLGALSVFFVVTAVFAHRSFRTLHKASTAFGVAFALFLPTMSFTYFWVPKNIQGLVEVSLMAGLLIAAFIIAIRILWKGDQPYFKTNTDPVQNS
jgi:hypothetical protein